MTAAGKTSVGRQFRERGYVLLALLLLMALLVISAAIIAPTLAFQIRRDREEELVHRGVQYSRAIRSFAKKTGRYPVTLEQLRGSGSGDIRYIRKLYKDPVTGSDFRLLHMGDVPMPNLPVPNANAGSTNAEKPAASDAPATAAPDQAAGTTDSAADPQTAAQKDPAPNDSRYNKVGQVIFGVASKSKSPTIREFNHKNHYNEWLFFYDPHFDRGTEIKGPTPLTPPDPAQSAEKTSDTNQSSQ